MAAIRNNVEKATKPLPAAAKAEAQAKKPGVTKKPKTAETATAAEFKAEKSVGSVTAKGLHPAVSPAMQKATFERVFQLGKQMVAEGKVPVIVLDHRHTALDDRPIVKQGVKEVAQQYGITELLDVDAALANGTLKSLPGYTAEASNAWRAEHPELVAKYPQLGGNGRFGGGYFMGKPVSMANAVKGLDELAKRWALETGGKGEIIFAGAGTGTSADFANIYARPVAQGGAGFAKPDVRFGAPAPTAEGDAKSQAAIDAFNAAHPNEEPVVHDHDSRGKAGWIQTIEREKVGGQQRVVVAFVDDRAHNRLATQAVGVLGSKMLSIKSVAPGLSFSQNDNANVNQISTFSPNP